jgi:hypothetical protein
MRTRLLRRPSAGVVVALIALFVAVGGSAAAATKLIITGANVKNHSLTGNDIKKGSLTGAAIKKDSLTGKQIKESSLGKVPSAANADAVGGKGAASFEPAHRSALIAGTATGANVLSQTGGFGTVTRVDTGFYLVDAGENVTGKQLSATPNLAGGFAQVDVAPCGGTANNPGGVNCPTFNDSNHVEVRTLNAAGTAATDATFYISIRG